MKVYVLFNKDSSIYGIFASKEIAEKIQRDLKEVQWHLWFDEYPVETE